MKNFNNYSVKKQTQIDFNAVTQFIIINIIKVHPKAFFFFRCRGEKRVKKKKKGV